MLHQNALLATRNYKLEVVLIKRKARKGKRLQYGSALGYSTAVAQVAAKASTAPRLLKKTYSSSK
jgi:hypothetical protein